MFWLLTTLAQRSAGTTEAAAYVALGFSWVIALAVGWAVWERSRRQKAERQGAAMLASSQLVSEEGQRNAVMFEQHRKLNDLQIAKLTGEIELLKRQAGRPSDEDRDRLEAAKEFHELMVEKARLEMDSLRLHIAEQRRRIDDWQAGHD